VTRDDGTRRPAYTVTRGDSVWKDGAWRLVTGTQIGSGRDFYITFDDHPALLTFLDTAVWVLPPAPKVAALVPVTVEMAS
jgi:hypothetical protein